MLDHQMLTFITVAEKKNFSRAAEVLNLTQPAISLQIQSMEEQFGVRLFERNNKRVELTQAGTLLLTYAEKILRLHQEAEQALRDLIGIVSGKLVIGASFTIGEYILPRLLAVYTSTYPQVDVSVTISNTDSISERLMNNEIDVGLVEGVVSNKHMEVTPILQDEMVLVLPEHHRLAKLKIAEPHHVLDERLIMRESGSGTRQIVEAWFKDSPGKPEKIIEFSSTQSIKEAVEAGLGISLLSKWTIRKEIQLGVLHAVRLSDPCLCREISLLWKKDRFHSRAAEEFLRTTKNNAKAEQDPLANL